MAVDQPIAEDDFFSRLAEALADSSRLRRIVFSKPVQGKTGSMQKVTIQPILLRGKLMLQFSSYLHSKKVMVKNHDIDDALRELGTVVRIHFRHVTLLRSDATIRFDTLADGTTRVTQGAPEATHARPDLGHDRKKHTLLTPENAREVLSILGFITHGGGIKPSMQKKLRQVNEFVRIVDNSSPLQAAGSETLNIIDCGCGNAYLTFALFHFLTAIRQRTVLLTGIDRDPDAISRNTAKAGSLGLSGISFVQTPISGYAPSVPPDIVLSLHACDTATDDAIANAILWKARLVLCAPCCHHHINRQLKVNHDTLMTRSMSRHGILVEKMGDALTDLFRVLVLAIMGYQVHTLKFVDPDNTERNTLIKADLSAVSGEAPPPASSALRYKELRDFWNVTPFLEEALGALFRERLDALLETSTSR